MTDINEDAPAPKPKRTLSPEHKAKLAAGRQRAVQSAPRALKGDDPVHEPIRDGKAQALGRDGEVLTRKRTTNSDQFHIPPEIIPTGWDYQWQAIEVTGQPQTAAMIAMAENGWRPVPASRHPGRFMPADYPPNGPIVRDGLRLEERPMILTIEARREEALKAGQLVKDQVEQLGLSTKMPDGFSRDNGRLRQMERAGTSRTYAPEPSIPRPQLPIDPAA